MVSVANTKAVIQPIGSLTAATSKLILSKLDECLAARVRLVLIDMQRVNFVDSSGVGALVTMHTKLRLAGSRLCLFALQEQASCLFDITDLDSVFEVFDTQEACYVALGLED